jgi:hypothetical protein
LWIDLSAQSSSSLMHPLSDGSFRQRSVEPHH